MSTTTTPIKPRPEFAGILKEDVRYAREGQEQLEQQINGSFDRLMLQSGLRISPATMLSLCLLSAIALGGIVFVIQENLITTALAAGLGIFIPIVVALIARYRRQSQIMQLMPNMADEMARAAKTGRSLEQCFELVAADTPNPLGEELRVSLGRMALGLDIASAIRDLPQRTGLVSMSVFVMALTVHQQTGGDLVMVLDRLATTIRDRLSFLGRLRAATATSRATAILMIGLPPAVLLFFMFRDPNYLSRLLESGWARGLTLMAIVLQLIGAIWVLRILRNSQRSY